jgi:ribonucleoside-triphosphate reductase
MKKYTWTDSRNEVEYLKVIKLDGREEKFDSGKIYVAVYKATKSLENCSDDYAHHWATTISQKLERNYGTKDISQLSVPQIQNDVERELMLTVPAVAKKYVLFRQKRTDIREMDSTLMKTIEEISAEMKPDNANVGNSAAAKMYGVAEAASKQYTLTKMLSPLHAKNHQRGAIYVNDMGYFPYTVNCFYNPLGRILAEGFNNGVGRIRPPKSVGAAMALAAIVLQSSQNEMFGGQGVVSFDTDISPYVELEYLRRISAYNYLFEKRLRGFIQVLKPQEFDTKIEELAMEDIEKSCFQACEAFIYNMNTMRSRSGAQVTFSSINLGTDTNPWARMVTRNILKAYISGLGNGENPIFPNIGFRLKNGVNLKPGDPNYDLYQLALECMSTRIQPRFVFCDSPLHKENWETASAMGCRTCVVSDIHGSGDPVARGNLAFNTISLPLIALDVKAVGGNFSNFYSHLEVICDQAIEQLHDRYQIMKNFKVRDIPFVSNWYQGGENLKPEDSIEPMIKHGSLSMGFLGLAECLVALLGEHHGQSTFAQQAGIEIISLMRRKTNEATKKYNLNFSLFASPAESACHTLMKKAQKQYGNIPGVTDKTYFTNSFHLPVNFSCNIEQKIDIEAPYHAYCNAGAIMYVELGSSPKNNLPGVERIITYMAQSGATYGGANFTHYFCPECNYQGDMPEGKCPICNNEDVRVTAIITGYLSTDDRFNPGKQDERAERVSHGGGGPLE